MKHIARVLIFILVFVLFTEIQASMTYADTKTNDEYVKELEARIAEYEQKVTSLEEQNAVLDGQIVSLERQVQAKNFENDNLWRFIETTSDYQDLARIVEAEAGGETYEGKLYVASVVVNRVDYGFASTVHDVIYQPGQFSPVKDGRFTKAKVSNESVAATEEIIKYGSISDALFFMNPKLASEKGRTWMQTLNYVTTVGNHEFYRY